MLHVFAALAEKERAMISSRTKSALSAAKAKGVKLGNPNLEAAREMAVGARVKIADDFAASILPVVAEIQATGATILRAIADALNRRGFKTPRGRKWAAMSVKMLLQGVHRDRVADSVAPAIREAQAAGGEVAMGYRRRSQRSRPSDGARPEVGSKDGGERSSADRVTLDASVMHADVTQESSAVGWEYHACRHWAY